MLEAAVHEKTMLCPVCNKGKILFADQGADPIRLIKPGSRQKAKWYVKCQVCKSQVGFSVKR